MLVHLFLEWIARFFGRSKSTPVVMPQGVDEQKYTEWYRKHIPMKGLTAEEEANYISYLKGIGVSYEE